MLQNVEVQFCPPEINCLAWSKDGILSIAAQEDLHVLIPKRRDEDSTSKARKSDQPIPRMQERDQWDQVHFPVNVFTKQEWPLQELASSRDFSIGEEQSMSEVISLAWSPPDLGRHRRCLLAILTTNLLLSMWDPGPDPSVPKSWQRVMIINDYIDDTPTDERLTETISRARRRIRAAKWSSVEYEQSKFHYFLSVINDYREVIFLWVRSDRNPLNSSTKRLHVKTIFRTSRELFEDEECDELRSDLALLALPKRGRVEHDISWGPWEAGDKPDLRWKSTVICRTNGKARRFELEYFVVAGKPHLTSSATNSLTYTEGQVLWWELRSTLQSSNQVKTAVVYGMRDAVKVRMVNQSTTMGAKRDWKFPLLTQVNGIKYRNWASISGMCTSINTTPPLLCVATQQSDLARFVVQVQPGYDPKIAMLDPKKTSTLEGQMLSCKQAFASLHDLHITQVGLNIRGLASWQEEWIVMCITLRPTDRVSYITKGKERATLIFSHAGLEDGSAPLTDAAIPFLTFPWQSSPPSIDPQTIRSNTLDSILDWTTTKTSIPDRLSRRILYNALCAIMFSFASRPFPNLPGMWDTKILPSLRLLGELRPTRREDRYTHSRYNISLPDDDDGENPDENLASAFLADLAPTWKHGGGEMKDTDTMEWLNNCIRSRSVAEKKATSAKNERLVEVCSVCCGEEPLLWVSLGEAECANGHRWERCSLTFLAIQEPGVSKYCERCGAQYCNEEYLLRPPAAGGMEEGDDDDDEAKTLTEYVFTRFSVCIFCRGKFVSEVRGRGSDDDFAFLA